MRLWTREFASTGRGKLKIQPAHNASRELGAEITAVLKSGIGKLRDGMGTGEIPS